MLFYRRLTVFSNGCDENSKGFLSLVLNDESNSDESNRLEYNICIMDANNKKVFEHKISDKDLKTGSYKWPKFVSWTQLYDNILIGGNLYIFCEIHVVQKEDEFEYENEQSVEMD